MTTFADQLTDKVFKRVEGNPSTNDMRSFNVLQVIDGIRSVGTIAQQEHYELEDLAAIIEQLVKQGAIVPVDAGGSKVVGADFLKNMEAQLSLIMGPVSGMIIEEHVTELGIDRANVPINKAHEIISLVSNAIPDKSQSETFVRNMTASLDSSH